MSNILTVFIDDLDNYDEEIREDLEDGAFHCFQSGKDYMYKVVLTEDQVEIHDTVGRMVPISLEAVEEMSKAFAALDSLIHKQNVMNREYEQWTKNLFSNLGGALHVQY